MYDKHLQCDDYYKFRRMIRKLYDCDDVRYSVSWLKSKIDEAYEANRLQAGQYDHLTSQLQDLEY